MHRWDAETALGRASVLDPALAADGVAEVIDTMAPRQVTLGRSAPLGQALRLASTDTGESWVLGPGPPAATVSASAPDLLLLLWRRRLPGAPEFRWRNSSEARHELRFRAAFRSASRIRWSN